MTVEELRAALDAFPGYTEVVVGGTYATEVADLTVVRRGRDPRTGASAVDASVVVVIS